MTETVESVGDVSEVAVIETSDEVGVVVSVDVSVVVGDVTVAVAVDVVVSTTILGMSRVSFIPQPLHVLVSTPVLSAVAGVTTT